MLTTRAWAVIGGAVLLWLTSRALGAPDLHMIAVGLLALVPLSALLVRAARHDLAATRRLSSRRVFPGTRVRVDLDLRNMGRRRTSLLLLEDRLPSTLGTPARAVTGEIRPGTGQTVSYHLTPRVRGRYAVGPLSAWVADPFDLIRQRIDFGDRHDLVVYPAVEELGPSYSAAPVGGTGESSTRQLFRTGDDFYTMRGYEIGDDLRKIHWPSVARTGELMIRQDEAVRRASAVLFLDTRGGALGDWPEAFERSVSVAASIGAHHLRAGFTLRLALADAPPRPVDTDGFLELLAQVRPSPARQLTPSMRALRSAASAATSLVVVTHVPPAEELAAWSRLSGGFATRLAVVIHRSDVGEPTLPASREDDRAAHAATTSLTRAGWEVLVLRPSGRLREIW
ncbi:MAG TPA: DUF58 domain-containing protein, partial [Actinomycetota bacterium]|nr:DUF58 domain-containing protein [Actinomycetota bacterium]